MTMNKSVRTNNPGAEVIDCERDGTVAWVAMRVDGRANVHAVLSGKRQLSLLGVRVVAAVNVRDRELDATETGRQTEAAG